MLPLSVLGALDGRLGPHLGPLMLTWAQNAPSNGPRNLSKTTSKSVPKMILNLTCVFLQIVGPILDSLQPLLGAETQGSGRRRYCIGWVWVTLRWPLVPPRWFPMALTQKRAPKAVSQT